MDKEHVSTVATKFTSDEFNAMDKKTKMKHARKNMKSALNHLKKKKSEDVMEFFDFDEKTLDRRILASNWVWREINLVVAELDPDMKLQLFNPAGFGK